MKTTREPITFVSRQVESSRLFFLNAAGNESAEGNDVTAASDMAAASDGVEDGFEVVFGGFERCRTDYRIDRRSFPWHCLEYVDRGRGFLHLEHKDHEIGAGSFYLYGPGQAHRIESSAEHPLRKYFVGFSGRGVEVFLARYGIVCGTVARCIKGEAIRLSFDLLIDRGVRKSPLAAQLCSLVTRQLLVMCRDDAGEPVNTASPAFLTYARARDLIEERCVEFPTLEAVAAACGADPAYLCRLFSRFHDESPYQFLTRVRMDLASRLLLDGAQSVKGVAAALGFKDPFHFSRVFKSVHHVPPSRFSKGTR